MTHVEVYHNTTAPFEPYRPEHALELVYATDIDHPVELEDVFHTFNVGHEPDFSVPDWERKAATEYRARYLRSLSVGDAVAIDGAAWACDRFGWRQIELPA